MTRIQSEIIDSRDEEPSQSSLAGWTRREFLRHGGFASVAVIGTLIAGGPTAYARTLGPDRWHVGIVQERVGLPPAIATLDGYSLVDLPAATSFRHVSKGEVASLESFAQGDEVIVQQGPDSVSVRSILRGIRARVHLVGDGYIETDLGRVYITDATSSGPDRRTGKPIPLPEIVATNLVEGMVYFDGESDRLIAARLILV